MVTVFIASHAVAQIYRCVDEHGVVHYEDCPPVDCAFEEVELPEGPSAEKIESAKAKMREILEARKARDHAAKLEIERIALEEREKQELVAEQLELCAETIELSAPRAVRNTPVRRIRNSDKSVAMESCSRPAHGFIWRMQTARVKSREFQL